MRIVLTEKELDESRFADDVQVKKITYKGIEAYNHDMDVVAIVGSRGISVKVNQLDFPNLKFYQLTSAGLDGVPLFEFRSKGITVANVGNVYSIPIAETVIYGMLSMSKKLRANPNNRHIKIQRHYKKITELQNKKVMILGAGNIGNEIAKRLVGFDMSIYGYAQREGDRPFFNHVFCEKKSLLNHLSECDYVISTLPSNENTRGLIDKEFLNCMKHSSVLVNVGRKDVIKQEDLYQALMNRQISGAVLDMFEVFPNPITNKFRRLRNVIVLPGVAAISQEVNERLKSFCTENILKVINDEKPSCIV